MAGTITRRAALAGALGTAVPARAAARVYVIGPRDATVGLAITQFGLFPAEAAFRRFMGRLAFDPAAPEAMMMRLEVAAASAEMADSLRTTAIRSAAFLDVARYPDIRFASDSVQVVAPDIWRVEGLLELRGVTHRLALDARLTRGSATDDFVVTGALSRAEYGMRAERLAVGDTVRLTVRARLAHPA